jgi:hypothetical protein
MIVLTNNIHESSAVVKDESWGKKCKNGRYQIYWRTLPLNELTDVVNALRSEQVLSSDMSICALCQNDLPNRAINFAASVRRHKNLFLDIDAQQKGFS